MSESKTNFSSLVLSDIIQCCSFILSHPLYFSYFIFFSPYLFKLISFLSPLFLTTFLLSLAIFTTDLIAQSNVNHHLVAAYTSFLERLKSQKDDENEWFHFLDDLQMYEIVFGSSVMEFEENQVEILEEKTEGNHLKSSESTLVDCSLDKDSSFFECEDNKIEENQIVVDDTKMGNCGGEFGEKRMENFLKILDEFERMSSNVEGKKKVERQRGAKADKDVEKQKAESLVKCGSEARICNNKTNSSSTTTTLEEELNPKINGGKELNTKIKVHSQRVNSNVDHSEENGRKSALKAESSRTLSCNFGSSGSMRKEKEWKRTLACKLFEERHNVEGGEGMDSLWETYENESSKSKSKNDKYKKKKKDKVQILEEYGNEDEDELEGQLCCLQALKLSAGKMNMGVGRPNLVKISKAIKGIGWLSSHVFRHSKKVHNNGDRY